MRHVIYSASTGVIRAIMQGTLEAAQMNVLPGEALLSHAGYVSPQQHRVENGAIVPR